MNALTVYLVDDNQFIFSNDLWPVIIRSCIITSCFSFLFFRYGYAVREYNQQSAAVEVTSRSENEVKSFYSCRDPSETSAMSYGSDFSQYFSDFFQLSSEDSTPGRSDFFANFESFKDLCPIYELYSSDEEYYDYDRDGLLDYCRFNIGTSINNINLVMIILLNAISILLGYSTRLS